MTDLAPYGVSVVDAGRGESFGRTTFFDGAYTLDYSYQHAADSATFLNVTIQVERTTTVARQNALAARLAVAAGIRAGGLTLRSDTGTFRHGEDPFFATVMAGERPGGQVLVTRHGRAVYTVVLFGHLLPWPEAWQQVLSPKLTQLDSLLGSGGGT